MRGSEHENGAASAAPETTPTIGQRPVPVCLQCVTGAVDSCGVQRTCAGGACQGGTGALAAWGVDDNTASLRRAGDQAGAHEVVHNLLKPCCIGVQGLAVSAGVEGGHFTVIAAVGIDAQKKQKKMFTHGQLVLIPGPQGAGHRHESFPKSVV